MAMPILHSLEEKIDPQLAALLVIDMRNDFFSPGGAWERTGEVLTLPQQLLRGNGAKSALRF